MSDVLEKLDTLRQMSPNGPMPERWHQAFWRIMDEAHAEIVRLRALYSEEPRT